jgi:hypothetical protein
MRHAGDDQPVVAEGPGGDEELGALPPPWPRRRLAMAFAGAGIVAGGLAVVSRTDSGVTPRSGSTSISVAVSTRVATEPIDMGLRVALASSPERCPTTITCFTDRLPTQAVAALQRLLPAATVRSKIAVTQTNPLRIYFRQLHATDGPVDVLVRITRSNILDGLEANERVWTATARRIAFVRVITADEYEVEVQLSAPLSQPSPIGLARALAADSALLTLRGS